MAAWRALWGIILPMPTDFETKKPIRCVSQGHCCAVACVEAVQGGQCTCSALLFCIAVGVLLRRGQMY